MNYPEIAPADRISTSEKIGYGLGDTASNLFWKLFENFQLFFYTNVFGIDPGSAGTMFLVTKLWDAVNDPLIGLIADRTRTAWGRFRPYLLWMSIPLAITGMMTFYTPDLEPFSKLVYAYITYTLVFMAYTAVNIPYGALMGVISSNSMERTSLSTYRFVLAFMGGLFVQLGTEPLLRLFGGSKVIIENGLEKTVVANPQAGFFWTVTCYGFLAVILFGITFATTRERVQPADGERTPLRLDLFDLMGNRPWLVLMFVGLFQILAGWTRGSAVAFYFTDYVGQEFGRFLAIGTIAGIGGMLFTRPLKAAFGAKNLMILCNLLNAIMTAAFLFLKSDQIVLMYALQALAAFSSGPVPILLWAMYADVADYSEWKNRRRATGLVFAAATFSQKLGGAIGSAVPGWCLMGFGFQKPVDGVSQTQTETALFGVVLLMSLIPAFFLACSAIAMLFYNINETLLLQMEQDLGNRKLISLGEMKSEPGGSS